MLLKLRERRALELTVTLPGEARWRNTPKASLVVSALFAWVESGFRTLGLDSPALGERGSQAPYKFTLAAEPVAIHTSLRFACNGKVTGF